MILNKIKTVILLGALSGLLLLIGNYIGGVPGIQMAFMFSLLMNGVAYFFSDKMVLRMYGATPLDKNNYASIYQTVEELTHRMKLPMPKLWLINMPVANAFATGRSPQNASVALTPTIIELLHEDELRGVLAHELGHVKNRDILVTTIAATFASAIGYLAHMLHYAAFWGSISSSRKRSGNSFVMLLIAIIMPIAATLIQLAISRSREYLADETGAQVAHPLALASALEKIELHAKGINLSSDKNMQHAATASLFIINPFIGKTLLSLFSTHPPTHKRVQRLQAMFNKRFS